MIFSSRIGLWINSLIWISVAAFGIYFLTHIRSFINFGIDLVGGTYIVLEVQLDEAIKNNLIEKVGGFVELLDYNKITIESSNIQEKKATLEFKNSNQAKLAYDTLKDKDQNIDLKQDNNKIIIELKASTVNNIKSEAIKGNIRVLRTRLDQMGASEVNIASQGENRILIELPDVKDIQEAKKRIGKTALLQMKQIQDMASSKEKLLEKYYDEIPEGMEIVLEDKEDFDKNKEKTKEDKNKKEQTAYLVTEYAPITGHMLENASAEFNQNYMLSGASSPNYVKIIFKPEAIDKWFDFTTHVAEAGQTGAGTNLIAMILDDKVISAAGVKEGLSGKENQLTGNFSLEKAKEIAMLLRSGAFTAKVKFAEERTIGPSLGKESIEQGLTACLIALALLFVFSIFYYKLSGFLAFIVLLYNLLLILFGLWYIGGTLTLPGIAGMVLTLGMAIDSSILIYEKIKEELRKKIALKEAVRLGFSDATGVILDANITTFIAALVLYYLGTGPIQGFAITMMIGIISTLITGIILLKFLFSFIFNVLGIQKVKF